MRTIVWRYVLVLTGLMAATATPTTADRQRPYIPDVVRIPAGSFIAGSDAAGQEYGYRLDERAYGHAITRRQKWYAGELDRKRYILPAYFITRTQITNGQYLAFVRATGHRTPDVAPATWKGYRLIHPYKRTRKFAWPKENGRGRPQPGKLDHPVVMVSISDARAYARWLSKVTGKTWRLPTELEWEKAARGTDGRRFPWGNKWDPTRANSHDRGPFETVPVGRYRNASPWGALDMAGQVFEWTSTRSRSGKYITKGGSWDDKGCGVCRAAARDYRPAAIKHILIGFRLVREE